MDYITILSRAAQNGDARAILYLGLAYLYGIPAIVEPYPEEAQKWLSHIRSTHPEWLAKYELEMESNQ